MRFYTRAVLERNRLVTGLGKAMGGPFLVSGVPPTSAKTSDAIEKAAGCGVRIVIGFLLAKHRRPIEIHRQICDVYSRVWQ